MNKAYQRQIAHDEKLQLLYERLLDKAETQGLKIRPNILEKSQSQINTGIMDDPDNCNSVDESIQ